MLHQCDLQQSDSYIIDFKQCIRVEKSIQLLFLLNRKNKVSWPSNGTLI